MIVLTILISAVLLGTVVNRALKPKATLKPIKVKVRK